MISKKIPVTKIRLHYHDQANRGYHSSMASRVEQSEVKCLTSTPTFPKFPTPTPKVTEVWRPRILYQLTLSGNRGTQKNSLFQQKFHKKLYQYNRNSQLRSVM